MKTEEEMTFDEAMAKVAAHLKCPLDEALARVERLQKSTGLRTGNIIHAILYGSFFDEEGTLRLCPSA